MNRPYHKTFDDFPLKENISFFFQPKASLTFSGHKATAGMASKFCRLNLQSTVWIGIGKHYFITTMTLIIEVPIPIAKFSLLIL